MRVIAVLWVACAATASAILSVDSNGQWMPNSVPGSGSPAAASPLAAPPAETPSAAQSLPSYPVGAMRMRPYSDDPIPSESSVATWYDPKYGAQSRETARLFMVASVPSVNLDNVPGFLSIACTNDTATATFASTQHVAKWKQEQTLLLIAAYHRCGPDNAYKFNMVLATSWEIQSDERTVKFAFVDPEEHGVKGEFKLIATPVSKNTRRRPQQPSPVPNSPVSPAADPGSQTDVSTKQEKPSAESEVPIALQRRGFQLFSKSGFMTYTKQKTVPINFNTSIQGGIRFPIPGQGVEVDAQCLDCGVSGNTSVTISVFGQLFPLKVNVTVEWSGSMEAHTDMQFDLVQVKSQKSKMTSVSVPIIEVPLHPYAIPGVFNAGPAFRLRGVIEYGITADTVIRMHLGARLDNFRASLSTKGGIKTSGFRPVYTTNITSSNPFSARLTFAIVPEFTVGVSVFGIPVFDAAAVRLKIAENNDIYTNDMNQVCFRATLSTQLEASILIFSTTIPLFHPITLAQSCNRAGSYANENNATIPAAVDLPQNA